MDTTVAEVMSTDLVVATRSTPYKELVRMMRERGVHALPVVDAEGRLVGIVTRRDLLGVFLRPDDGIRDRIRAGVLERLNLPEDDVEVEVSEGVATLRGKVEWRSLAQEIVTLAGGVDGVVGVVDQLEHYRDDTEPAPVRPSRRP